MNRVLKAGLMWASCRVAAADCAGCHQASAKKDMVFTRFYPLLR